MYLPRPAPLAHARPCSTSAWFAVDPLPRGTSHTLRPYWSCSKHVRLSTLPATMSAWRHHRRDPHILWPTVAAFLLTGYEGWLGGRVVAHELAPWIVTAHLVVAIVIVLLLVDPWLARYEALYRSPLR